MKELSEYVFEAINFRLIKIIAEKLSNILKNSNNRKKLAATLSKLLDYCSQEDNAAVLSATIKDIFDGIQSNNHEKDKKISDELLDILKNSDNIKRFTIRLSKLLEEYSREDNAVVWRTAIEGIFDGLQIFHSRPQNSN